MRGSTNSTIYKNIVIQVIRATISQIVWQRLQEKLVVFKPDVSRLHMGFHSSSFHYID